MNSGIQESSVYLSYIWIVNKRKYNSVLAHSNDTCSFLRTFWTRSPLGVHLCHSSVPPIPIVVIIKALDPFSLKWIYWLKFGLCHTVRLSPPLLWHTVSFDQTHSSLIYHILCMSQIFAAIMFVDDCGTKNPYQNSLSLWWQQNWKLIKILGREINSKAVSNPTLAKIVWAQSIFNGPLY
jgi:hypothetical protein